MIYPNLVLKSGRDRAISNRHPWIFSGAVKNVDNIAEEGDIVAVADNQKNILGYGFYAPDNQICCRMFEWGSVSQDLGAEEYWFQKLQAAQKLRHVLLKGQKTTAYRLVHAEGDFMPGIIIDIYGEIAVLQLLVKGTLQLKKILQKCLQELGFQYIYLKTKSSKGVASLQAESEWLSERPELPANVFEHGLTFPVNVEEGQKTGFFIDQRENRRLLQKLSAGKEVLNTFSYTGGFSLYALAGGATAVTSVDISKSAISLCEATIAQSNFSDRHTTVVADCFEFMRSNTHVYDIIVVDPPAFAKHARAVRNASRGYKDLNMLAIKAVRSGGLVMTYSCSQNIDKLLFQKIVFSAAADAGRNVRIVKQLHQPEDHPINIFHPEGEYLKGLLLYVE